MPIVCYYQGRRLSRKYRVQNDRSVRAVFYGTNEEVFFKDLDEYARLVSRVFEPRPESPQPGMANMDDPDLEGLPK